MDYKDTYWGFYFSPEAKEIIDEEDIYDEIFHQEAFKKCSFLATIIPLEIIKARLP